MGGGPSLSLELQVLENWVHLLVVISSPIFPFWLSCSLCVGTGSENKTFILVLSKSYLTLNALGCIIST